MRNALPGHHLGRRRLAALLAGTSVALAGGTAISGIAAQASPTGPGVDPGRNITVFHDLDFIAVYGYEPAGTPLMVEVLRGGSVIGRAMGPSRALPDGVGLEINHGVELTAALPGDCWDVQTPDIQPGDRVVVTAAGDTDEVTVDDIRWTGAPTLDTATGDVVVAGSARYADGVPIPASTLQADQFRNASGKYRITPTLESIGSDGRFQVRYAAPYEGDRNREGLTEDERREALLGNGHTVGFGHAEGTDLPAETQLVSGPAETNGPAVGCEAAPAGGGTPLPERESTPPTVTPLSPADGATGVDVATNITAQFDEAVSGLDGASVTVEDSGGRMWITTISYDPATRVVTINPTGSLTAGRVITVTVTSDVTDTSGNALAPTSWSFTTAAGADTTRPTVTGRDPAAGAVGVAPDSAVTATFSEAVSGVDGNSVTLAGPSGPVDATVGYDPVTRTATLTPSAPLQAGASHTVSLTAGIRDAAANTLTPTSWTFSSAAAAEEPPVQDTESPTVTTRTPAANATGVDVASTVTAGFSEPVTGISGATVTLTGPSGPVAASVGYDGVSQVSTLRPTAALAAGVTYTAAISDGVADAAGNALAPTTWTFTTATPVPPADTVRPTVTTRTPAANATGVDVASTVTATFSEPVTGVSGSTVTLRGGNRAVAATVSYDAATRMATLRPTAALAARTTYTAAISTGVLDTARNSLAATSWTFTTAAPDTTRPTVTSRTPAADATGVDRDADLTVTLSEPVSGVTATTFTLRTSKGTAVPAAVTYDTTTRVARLDPNATLAAGTRFTVGLTKGVQDAAGNQLSATSWSFTTVAAVVADTVRPTVSNRTPSANATNVARRTNVTVTFSEAVTGVSGTTVTLRAANGTAVPAAVSYDATTRTATLDPSTDLAARTTYTLSLTTAVRDAAGNQLAATSWKFTTAR